MHKIWYFKNFISEKFLDNFINRFVKNSTVEAGEIDKGEYIWKIIIVIIEEDRIIKAKGTAKIFANIEVKFKIEKW